MHLHVWRNAFRFFKLSRVEICAETYTNLTEQRGGARVGAAGGVQTDAAPGRNAIEFFSAMFSRRRCKVGGILWKIRSLRCVYSHEATNPRATSHLHPGSGHHGFTASLNILKTSEHATSIHVLHIKFLHKRIFFFTVKKVMFVVSIIRRYLAIYCVRRT